MLQPQRSGQRVTLEDGWVSPLYGVRHAAPRWCTHVRAADADFDTVLLPQEAQAFTRLEPVGGDAGDIASALEIHVHDAQGQHYDLWFHARDARSTQWDLRGLRFAGRWLHLRFDAQGVLRRAVTHAGARLDGAPSTALVTSIEGSA